MQKASRRGKTLLICTFCFHIIQSNVGNSKTHNAIKCFKALHARQCVLYLSNNGNEKKILYLNRGLQRRKRQGSLFDCFLIFNILKSASYTLQFMEQVINKQIHTFKTVFREMPSALLRTVKYVSYFITAHSFCCSSLF